LKIVVIAAHTDDGEVGVGGTIINLLRNNHKVMILNLSGDGEARKKGEKTAKILGCQVRWITTYPTCSLCEENILFKKVENILDRYRPYIIFSHWPVDEHPDHRLAGSIAIRYVNSKEQKFVDAQGNTFPREYYPFLLFYEVLTGKQTKCFSPSVFIEFTKDVVKQKKTLMDIYAKPWTDYSRQWYHHHLLMMKFRALESGVARGAEIKKGLWAEAFVPYPAPRTLKRSPLPGER